MRLLLASLTGLIFSFHGSSQTAVTQRERGDSSRMVIVLERLTGTEWAQVDPGLVFHQQDRIRFRFRANFNGYLYVSDRGTSGSYDLLFPGAQTGLDNKIVTGREYLIPATRTRFRISGPAGHDVVFWMVSPTKLAAENAAALNSQAVAEPAMQMTPRCDDALFQARGECIDSQAGPRPNGSRELSPDGTTDSAHSLLFTRKNETAVVSATGNLTGPVVYEYHLAHE